MKARVKLSNKKVKSKKKAAAKANDLYALLNKHADLRMAVHTAEECCNIADNAVDEHEEAFAEVNAALTAAETELDLAEEALFDAKADLRDFEEKYKEYL